MINSASATLYVPNNEAVEKYMNDETWSKIGLITTSTEMVPVTDIVVTPAEATISVMGEITLTASVYPAEAEQKVSWTSSDKSVAVVSNQGVVFGMKEGICTITASAVDGSGIKGECALTVGDGKRLQLNMPSISGYPGEKFTLTADVSPENTTIEWSVEDNTIASLDPFQNMTSVKLLKAGETTVKATASNGLSQEIPVTVKEPVILTGIAIEPATLECEVGDKIYLSEFTVRPVPEDANGFNPDFRIEDDSIIDYDPDDEEMETFECLSAGTTKFIWSQDDIEGVCTITVKGEYVPLTGIVLNPSEINGVYNVGDEIQITATPEPLDASEFEPEWSSTNTAMATVDNNGLVTIVSVGEEATIVCKSGAVQAECHILPLPNGFAELIYDDNGYSVVSVDGTVVMKCESKKELEALPAGIYIINGKKIIKGYQK